jgi:hypothetical protein
VPPAIREKYALALPAYPGTSQVVRLSAVADQQQPAARLGKQVRLQPGHYQATLCCVQWVHICVRTIILSPCSSCRGLQCRLRCFLQ